MRDLICPPYDVIPPEDHDRLLAHSPWNSVRWILGIDPQKPKGSAEDYRRRGKEVRNWIEEGILRKEEERSLYSYTFRYRSIEGSQRSYHCILGEGPYPPAFPPSRLLSWFSSATGA